MRIIFLLSLILAGCASQPKPMAVPAPAPIPSPPPRMNGCAGILVGNKCQPFTAGNVGGTTIGHSNEIEDLPAKAGSSPD